MTFKSKEEKILVASARMELQYDVSPDSVNLDKLWQGKMARPRHVAFNLLREYGGLTCCLKVAVQYIRFLVASLIILPFFQNVKVKVRHTQVKVKRHNSLGTIWVPKFILRRLVDQGYQCITSTNDGKHESIIIPIGLVFDGKGKYALKSNATSLMLLIPSYIINNMVNIIHYSLTFSEQHKPAKETNTDDTAS